MQAPGDVGLAIGITVAACGIAQVVTDADTGWHRTAVVDPLQGLAFIAAFHAQRQGAVQVERDHQLRLHRPLAVPHFTVGRQVHTAAAPQRLAVAQVDQPGTRSVTGAHVEVASANAAVRVQVDTEGNLFAAFAQLHVRGAHPAQVGIIAMALQALVTEADALAVVLVAKGDLVAFVALEPALRQGSVEHAEIAHAHVATQPSQHQRLRRFGVGFQGEHVTEPIAQAARGNTRPIAEIAYAVIPAQAAGGHRVVRQVLLQQAAGDIERQGGRHLPAKGISGDHHRLPGPVDERHVGQGVRAWLQFGGAGLETVDEQVERRGDRRFTGERRQRVSDKIRTHREVA
ncbi:hypothetical protein D9M71_437430 [compost metagenome]